MGITYIEVNVGNPARPNGWQTYRLLVDSGALYSVLPRPFLEELGIQPHSTRGFILADGTSIEREIGDAEFELQGQRGASPVIFGEPGDAELMGTVTLEALGFVLDAIRRELRPARVMM